MWRDLSDSGSGVGRAHGPLSSALYLSVTLPPSLSLASPGFPSPPLAFETLCQGPLRQPHCGGEKKGTRHTSGLVARHSLHTRLRLGPGCGTPRPLPSSDELTHLQPQHLPGRLDPPLPIPTSLLSVS